MLNISRVAALPGVLEANTVYLVTDGASGLQVTVTGSTAAVIKSTRSNASITSEITAAVDAMGSSGGSALTTAVNDLTGLINAEATARANADTAAAAADATAMATEAQARVDGDAATLAAGKTYADNAAAVAKGEAQAFATAADTALQGVLEAEINTLETETNAAIATLGAAATSYTDQRATAAQAAAIAHADALVAGLDMSNTAAYAADIAARDAMVAGMTKNTFVMVADATGDATVGVGSALYFRNINTNTWTKVAEYESMDITIPNLNILEELGDSNGLLTYKGSLVATVQHSGSEW